MTISIHHWTGLSGDHNIGTVGNWYNETAGATTVSFGDGDTLYIIAGSDTSDITTGTLGPTQFAGVYISFDRNIGTSSASITVNASNGAAILQYSGTGSYCNITAGASGITNAKIVSTGPGTFRLAGGTTTNLEVGQGANVTVDPSAVVTNGYTSGGSIVADTGTAFTSLVVTAGTVQTARNITNAEAYGSGSLLVMTQAATFATSGKIMGGARANFRNNQLVTIAAPTVGANSRLDAVGATRNIVANNITRYGNAYVLDNETGISVSKTGTTTFRGIPIIS
jgi:hypothetical protein